MGITALALGGWISVYCGVSLLRTCLRENQPNLSPSSPERKLAVIGYTLVIVGLIILARGFFHRFL
jgi:hypothetical protein